MKISSWLLGGGLLLMSFVCFVQYRDLSALRRQLKSTQAECSSGEASDKTSAAPPRESFIASLLAPNPPTKKERPTPRGEATADTFVSRANARQRLMERVTSFLGRSEHETEEAYRARMKPLIEAALDKPRLFIEDLRTFAQQEAKMSSEQSAALDQIVAQAQTEAIKLINDSLASGALTPYRINASGALQVAGGLGDILQRAESGAQSALRPEQLEALRSAGFDLAEYLALTTPWETLTPPPQNNTPE